MAIHYTCHINIEHERQIWIVKVWEKDNSKVTFDRIVIVILEIWVTERDIDIYI